MEPGHWPSEHSDALRDYFRKGMSYAEIGRQINARFGTAYTRSAVIGRAKRLGLVAPEWITSPSVAPYLPGEPYLISPRRAVLPNLNLPPKSAMKPAARASLPIAAARSGSVTRRGAAKPEPHPANTARATGS